MLASFVARNTDLWVHLAAGKRLAAGQYFPGGSDPFSYSGAGRTWVNHSWLWDLGAYALYGGKGVLVVFVKALAVAAAGALLIGICRPGFPIWPWAATAAIGFIAAAPRLTLNPTVGSVLLLAVTLFILYRVPSRPGSWRVPVALAVTFWVWANTDAWFVLGPLTLALVYAGEVMQRKYLELTETREGEQEEGPLGRFPDEKTLLRALGVGLVACCLTPHHFRVWQLPFELVGSDVIKVDPSMNAGLNLAPTDKVFYDQDRFGYNLSGLAYAILLAGGGIALGVGAGLGTGAARPRLTSLALWVVFAAMSMVSVFAIPFLAVIAVPVVAGQLNAFSLRAKLGNRGERWTRFVLLGSGGGRVLSLAALVVACACAWPGWLHPPQADFGGTRRVAYRVEPDPGLARAATQIQGWHESGTVPKDAHGLIASVALADYCAWFAPDEKVFINSRFQYHRPELPDFIAVRGAVGIFDRPEEAPSRKDATAVVKKHGAVYLAMYNSRGAVATWSGRQRGKGEFRTVWDVLGWDDWATWYHDGRTLVVGWRPGAATAGVAQGRVELDPVILAFGPSVERIPPGRVVPARPPASWTDEFVRSPRPTSHFTDDALGWMEYKQVLRDRSAIVHLTGALMRLNTPTASGVPIYPAVEVAQTDLQVRSNRYVPPQMPDGSFHATPFLAVRAARRAITAEPDHPDGYYALALALSDPDLMLTEGERTIGQVIALRQCLDRMPPPDRFRAGVYAASPTAVSEQLTRLYLGITPDGKFGGYPLNLRPTTDGLAGLGRLLPIDLALKALQRGVEYARVEFRTLPADVHKKLLEELGGQVKRLEDAVGDRFAAYDQQRERARTATQQYALALQQNLIGEAIRVAQESTDLGKDFGQDSRLVAVQLATLLLCTGRLEEANEMLAIIRKESETANPADPNVVGMRAALRLLEYHVAVFAGNYGAAGALLEAVEGPGVLVRPAFPPPHEIHGAVLPVVAPLCGFDGPLWMPGWLMPGLGQSQYLNYGGAQVAIGNQMQRESSYFFVRGFLALLEGDVPQAKVHFRGCFRVPPAGWNLPNLNRVEAMSYLQLIDQAEQRDRRRATPR
jgi:hypothetical protein